MRRVVGGRIRLVLAAVAWLVTACAAPGVAPTVTPGAPVSQAPTVAATTTPPRTAPPATPIPGCLPACVTGRLKRPGNLSAGPYTTAFFFGGQLTVTLGEGWASHEDSTGELALTPRDHEGAAVLFWIDIYPIVDPTSKPVPGVARTTDAVLAWTAANPNLKVLKREPTTLGGLRAEALDLGRAAGAADVDPGCPSEFRPCVGLFGYPEWGMEFFSEGGDFHLRLIAATATWGGQTHALYAMIDAMDEQTFQAVAPAAIAIIEGAQLPLGVSQ